MELNFLFFINHFVEIWLLLNFSVLSLYLLFVKNFYSFSNFDISDKINYYLIVYFISFIYMLINFINNFNIIYYQLNILFKCMFLIISIIFLLILKFYIKNSVYKNFYPEMLILFSASMLGLYLVLCSKDFIHLYLSIELYSLSIYGVIFFFNNSYLNSSIKYFINGSVSSILLLFSIVLIYNFTGSFSFEALFLHSLMTNNFDLIVLQNIFFLLGIILFIISFILKLGLAPFYLWALDTYTTQPFFIFFYLLIIVKFTLINFLINFFIILLPNLLKLNIVYYIFFTVSIMSTIIGTFGIINQNNLKKIFFYSSLSNTIFLLMPFLNNSSEIIVNYLIFIIFYFINLIGFLIFFNLFINWSRFESILKIDNFIGLFFYNSVLAVLFSILLLSFTGFPPFLGFFIKFSFLSSIYNFSPFLSIILIISNVISNIYSWWIITLIFFYKKNTPSYLLIKPSFSVLFTIIVIVFYFNFFLVFNLLSYLYAIFNIFG